MKLRPYWPTEGFVPVDLQARRPAKIVFSTVEEFRAWLHDFESLPLDALTWYAVSPDNVRAVARDGAGATATEV